MIKTMNDLKEIFSRLETSIAVMIDDDIKSLNKIVNLGKSLLKEEKWIEVLYCYRQAYITQFLLSNYLLYIWNEKKISTDDKDNIVLFIHSIILDFDNLLVGRLEHTHLT